MVDIGWHTFILYTRDYSDFCQRVAGRYLHHAPSDVSGTDNPTGAVSATLAALRAHHLPVDELLWACDINSEGPCDNDGCTKDCEVFPAPKPEPKPDVR